MTAGDVVCTRVYQREWRLSEKYCFCFLFLMHNLLFYKEFCSMSFSQRDLDVRVHRDRKCFNFPLYGHMSVESLTQSWNPLTPCEYNYVLHCCISFFQMWIKCLIGVIFVCQFFRHLPPPSPLPAFCDHFAVLPGVPALLIIPHPFPLRPSAGDAAPQPVLCSLPFIFSQLGLKDIWQRWDGNRVWREKWEMKNVS